MAREHARIWLDINSDDDFEQLPFDAQGLYTRVILTLDDLSYCGVATWRPRKLTTKAPDLSYERILCAASALEIGRYCLFDLDTEEVLARSFIRRDQLLRNPKYAAAVVRTYSGIASKTLRAAVVTEVRRVRDEHPEYSSWSATNVGAELSKLMAKPGLDEVIYTNQIVVQITNSEAAQIGNADSVVIGNPVGNAESVPVPLTLTLTPTPSPLEGYVTGERHQDTEPDPNDHPRICSRHPHGTDKPCRQCQVIREANQRDHDQHQASEENHRREFWDEIHACPACDDNGLVDIERGVARCPDHDWERANA